MRAADAAVPAEAAAGIPELALVAAANATAVLDQRDALMWRSRLDALQPVDDTKDEWLHAARLLLDVGYGRAFGTDSAHSRPVGHCSRSTSGPTHRPCTPSRLRQAELLLDCDVDGEEATLRALLDGRFRASRIATRWIVDECDVLLAVIAAVPGGSTPATRCSRTSRRAATTIRLRTLVRWRGRSATRSTVASIPRVGRSTPDPVRP